MAYYKATVEILVDVDDSAEACDCIAEACARCYASTILNRR